MKKYHDHLYAARKGLLSATDDAILSENFIGTLVVQMSGLWKSQFPKITMVSGSLGLASPNYTGSQLSLRYRSFLSMFHTRNHWRKHLSLGEYGQILSCEQTQASHS